MAALCIYKSHIIEIEINVMKTHDQHCVVNGAGRRLRT